MIDLFMFFFFFFGLYYYVLYLSNSVSFFLVEFDNYIILYPYMYNTKC